MARILDMISSPADLKVLTDDELAILASEIREQMISTTSRTGGHLAPSLGVVELVLACHSVLNCPKDKLVFDVGHQSYAHKLVTGRLEQFDTLRTFGGISGFTKPNESEYDQHPSGHASDSLSVALGLAMARDLRGSDEKIVSIIGDAALSGGMAFEALNQIGQVQTPMVVILNDNEMSIAKNVRCPVFVSGPVAHLPQLHADPRQHPVEAGIHRSFGSRPGGCAAQHERLHQAVHYPQRDAFRAVGACVHGAA